MRQDSRPIAALIAAVSAAAGWSCGPKHVSAQSTQSAPATQPDKAWVVLLPDADTGSTGRIRVSNSSGAVELAAEREAVLASSKVPPGPVTTLTEAEVQRLFGDALAALAPPPRHFTLNFRFESDELTDESRELLHTVLATVKDTVVPEVVVIGHTDTLGRRSANYRLGLKRAMSVRNLLVEDGLSPAAIEVTSHGEADLLIKTPDETPEPRNRRVEIAVR